MCDKDSGLFWKHKHLIVHREMEQINDHEFQFQL